MGLKCHLDTEKQKFLMSLYFDKNSQTPQNDTVNSWRVKWVRLAPNGTNPGPI